MVAACTPTTDTVTAAAVDSYDWHGTTYNASGFYTFDSLNAAGCDSLTTLNLTIIPTPSSFSYNTPNIFNININIPTTAPLISKLDSTTLGYGLGSPSGIALDAAGNKYVSDAYNNVVYKIAAKSGLVSTIGTGFSSPYGVAVDAAGNVYVADYNNNAVKKIDAFGNITTIGSGFSTPSGVAVDALGNVYVADYGNKAVKKIDVSGNITTIGSGFSLPWSVAVNSTNGYVWVTDDGNNELYVINTSGTTVEAASFTNPGGISLDSAGNVYVADYSNGAIKKFDQNNNVSTIATGFTALYDVAVDASGNLFAADSARSQIIEILARKYTISPSLPTGLTIDSETGIISGKPTTLSSNTTYTVTAKNIVASTTTQLDISVDYLNSIWTGANSTDWNDPANWSTNLVPDRSSNVIIPSDPKNQPVINSGKRGTVFLHDLIIQSGASLTNNGILNVFGSYSDTGSFVNGDDSKVVLRGSGTISGSDTFTNLEIQGDYTVTDSIAVTQRLIETSGTLNTSNRLILISNASGTAMIDDEGGSLVGKVTVQHFADGKFGYHHFSSPISNGTVSSWAGSFPIFGPDGEPAWLSNRGSLQFYNEPANKTELLDSSYYNYTNLSNPLVSGQGYTAWLNSLPTLNTLGTPNNGPVTYPVTNTDTANATTQGWNLVGNPYPSPISWSALYNKNKDILADASCYLWQADGNGTNGTWETFNGSVGVNGAGDIINSSLGFFVYVSKSGNLNFDNSVRNYSYTSPQIFGTKTAATLRLSIKATNSTTTDEAVAYTSHQASFSRKMPQPATATNATIAFDVKGTKAAINVLTAIDSKTELPITVLTPKAGTYTLSLNTKNINLPVYLKDGLTGSYTDLSASTTITTSAKETSGRYSLVFSQPTVDRLPLTVAPNPARDFVTVKGSHIASLQVVDNLGRIVKVVALKDATNPTLNVRGLSAGAYHLSVQTTDGKVNGANLVVSY